MNDLIEFLTSKEIIVVYIVAAIACLLCFVIYLIDKNYDKRKRKNNTKELNRLVEEVNIELGNNPETSVKVPMTEYKEPTIAAIEPVVIPPVAEPEIPVIKETVTIQSPMESAKEVVLPVMIESITEEKIPTSSVEEMILSTMPTIKEEPEIELIYTEVEPNQTEAQQELLRLTQELEKAEAETKNIELTSFEETQEREAIISLEELMKKSKEMVASNEVSQYSDEGDEPISLADLEQKMKEAAVLIQEEPTRMESNPIGLEIEPIQEKMILDDFNNIQIENTETTQEEYQEHRKFQRSPVISPIYGIEKKEIAATEIELENTANYEKLDEEIKKTNEFLMTLRELQKNLD